MRRSPHLPGYARPMADRTHVRLAELVAALSLGIDLGFGQPMEHVLRQCLIALRLADRQGLPEQERVAVYYTALLINVGCHTDAYEQAKWFGDDIALKAGKYDRRRLRRRMLRLLGSGRPPLQRLRTGLEFAVSGRREVDDMISHHAEMARSLAAELGLPAEVLDALGAAYEQWDGKGWPGAPERRRDPARRAARPVRGVRRGRAPDRRRRGGPGARPRGAAAASSTLPSPRWSSDDGTLLAGLDAVATWDAVIEAEPALARRAVRRPDRRRAAGGRGLRRPQDAVRARARARGRRARGRGGGAGRPAGGRGADAAPRGARPRPRAARRLQRRLGQAGAARARASGSGCASSPT